jgi:hypothetical protein
MKLDAEKKSFPLFAILLKKFSSCAEDFLYPSLFSKLASEINYACIRWNLKNIFSINIELKMKPQKFNNNSLREIFLSYIIVEVISWKSFRSRLLLLSSPYLRMYTLHSFYIIHNSFYHHQHRQLFTLFSPTAIMWYVLLFVP